MSRVDQFKGIGVYENVNPKILDQYAEETMVLDIGCGSGALGAHIKALNPRAVVHGVDISQEAGISAQKWLDRFDCLDLDLQPLPDTSIKYDLIILGDVLEHLKRPDTFLSSLSQRLSEGGKLIVSVPNIANYSIRLRLLLGQFNYTDTGIMDRTHIRFFTYRSITELFDQCGFKIIGRTFVSRFPRLVRLLFTLFAVQFVFKLGTRDDSEENKP